MMNVRYQLPANVAFLIILLTGGVSTALVMHAIKTVDFEGVATERAQYAEDHRLN